VMPASGLGKLKMVAQVVAILALMLASDLTGEPGRWLHLLGLGAMWVVLGLAMWSAVEYYQTFAAVISGRTVPPGEAPIDPDPAAGSVLPRGGRSTTSGGPGSAAVPASVVPVSAVPVSPVPVSPVPASSPSAALAGSPRRS